MIAAAHRARRARAAPWWPATAALLLGTAGLGAALLIPYTFSDPNGVDPYVARISVVSVLLLAVTYVRTELVGARAVAIALAAVTGSFTLLAAGPAIIADIPGGASLSGDAQLFWASAAQLVMTGALAVLALRALPSALRPPLRVSHFGRAALLASVAGVVLLLVVSLALPANLLGRDGIQVALFRDLPWLWPANVLQALAQELQFRGLLMGALERVTGRGWANLGQAVFFGLAHLAVSYEGPVGPFVPVTIAVGLLFGWLVQRTNSLWPAVAVHAVADVAITAAVLPGLYGF